MRKYIAGIFKVFLTLFLLQGGVWFFGISAQAATVTDIYDQPSSLQTSTGSNHRITMTVTGAVNEGATLSITFPTGFDTSSITEDDVDVTDDNVELTTAANCSATEQVGVDMTSDVLTLTVCAGDGGAIGAGSVVVIEIGVNASSYGTGAHRISNPSGAGTYMLALGGTFGDKGSVPLPISAGTAASGVSAVIPSSGDADAGGSGGDGGFTRHHDTNAGDDTVTDGDATPDVPPDDTVVVPASGDDQGTPTDNASDSDTATGNNDGGAEVPSGDNSGGSLPQDTSSGSSNVPSDSSAGASDVHSDEAIVTVTTGVVSPEGVALAPVGESFSLLAGTTPVVRVEVSDTVAQVQVLLNGNVYPLTADGNTYSGMITVPATDGFVVVEVTSTAGEVTREMYTLDVVGQGMVYEELDGVRMPVAGAVVTIYQLIGGRRVAYTGVTNPLVLGENGAVAWYVPNGTYIVSAAKLGFEDGSSGAVVVQNNILSPRIALVRVAEVPVAVPDDTSQVPTPVITPNIGILERLRDLPAVQVALDIAAPATVALTAISVVVLASSFQLWTYLQYLITSPVLLFARRKRTAYGTVYNAATKLPIDLAIVRVFALPERKLLRSVVTDAKGKFFLMMAPGRYALEVTKPSFAFPSAILAGKKEDGAYLDVYGGQELVLTERDAVIAANIPLDPAVEAKESAHLAVRRRFLRVLQQVLAIVGVVLAFAVLMLAPSVLAGVMAAVQVFVYLLARRLAHPQRPKGWGVVYDATSREPVGNAVVRLFEPTYNKLIETVVTDRLGRYAFLVGPNEYYVTYAKPGYAEKVVRPLDFRTVAEPSTIALDVPIDEAKA